MLSDKIRQLRIESGKTQAEIASALNIEQPSYAGYESGKRLPRLDTLVKLAELFNVSCDYLLRDGFEKSPQSIYVVAQPEEVKEPDPLPDGGQTLIDTYKELSGANRRRLLMQALNLLNDQTGDVAEEPALKRTGTDGLGK